MSAKKSKNVDFLAISGRVKSKEIYLIDDATVDRLIAADGADVLKILGEHGYDTSGLDGTERNFVPTLVERDRADAAEMVLQTGKGLFDCFLYPHDYHNLKVALKNEILDEPLEIFTEGGSVPVKALRDAVKNRDFVPLTERMSAGVQEALEVYNKTSNSQMIDIVLDRYCFLDMADVARRMDISFLQNYVKTQIDVANVKALLRLRRMGKTQQFAEAVFFEGGSVSADRYAAAFHAAEEELPNQLPGVSALLQRALAELNGGGGMSAFELYCDNYLMDYIKTAKYISFGAEVPMAFLLAKETEYKVISMVLAGRQTGLGANSIKERLRALYV